MTTKTKLEATIIKALPTAEKGKRNYAWDTLVPGFAVRATDTGAKSFVLSAKMPGENNTRILTIGPVGSHTLADARDKARDMLIQISKGIDPRQTKADAKVALVEAKTEQVKNSFRALAEGWFATGLSHLRPRSLADIRHSMDNKFLPVWGDRDITTLTSREMADFIVALCTTRGRGAARTALSHLKQFCNYLVGRGVLPFSPCAALSGKQMLGKATHRDRILTDDELAKVWHSAQTLEEPLRQIYQLLILTGCRRNEVTHATWSEIDLEARTWTIPAARMKAKRVHTIPLTDMMIDIINGLTSQGGTHMFPNASGQPLRVGEREKTKMVRACGFGDWVNHDLRRTVRTGLGQRELGITFHIAELMVAHTQSELVRTYDKNEYLEEKRAGFQAWNAKVAQIAGLNVVKLAA